MRAEEARTVSTGDWRVRIKATYVQCIYSKYFKPVPSFSTMSDGLRDMTKEEARGSWAFGMENAEFTGDDLKVMCQNT